MLHGNLRLEKSELELGVKKMSQFNDKSGFQGLLRIVSSAEVWRQNSAFSSASRWSYIFTFTVSITCVLQPIILNSAIMLAPGSVFNKNRYLLYLFIGKLGILLWMPFELYSIEYSKQLLFSYEFKGFFSGFNIIIFATFFVVLFMSVDNIVKNAINQYKVILSLLILSSFVLLPLFSLFYTSVIDQISEISSVNPLTPWFASIVFFVPLFYLIVCWIDSSVGD